MAQISLSLPTLLLLVLLMMVTLSYALSGDIYRNLAEHRILKVSDNVERLSN